MCWSFEASLVFAAYGLTATAYGVYKNHPVEVFTIIGYFSIMEILQALTYTVIDQCDSKMNQILTIISYLHVSLQPFVLNQVALQLIPKRISHRISAIVYLLCAMSLSASIVRLYPFDWAHKCSAHHFNVFCGRRLCSEFGSWHLVWNLPLNTGDSFQMLEFFIIFIYFLLPILYGSYRAGLFFISTAIIPLFISNNFKEWGTVWCLSSIVSTLLLNKRFYSTLYVKKYFFWHEKRN
jgi:hypothetical protein